MSPAAQPAVTIEDRTLLVDGAPFVVLGGEIHNSSSSSVPAIRESFAKVHALGANTVLAPVSWAQFERVEGDFDATLIDAMIAIAAEHELRLIPLWFGSWKNGMSSYSPNWVKTDAARFERARTSDRGAIEHLSPFCEETRRADATAFAALLAHIRSSDPTNRVVMVQVQNEAGLLGDSRDRSAGADRAWAGEVPQTVIRAVSTAPDTAMHEAWQAQGALESGTWADVLGTGPAAEEVFMAWGYADFIESVARVGRAEHPVPLFSNVWLDSDIELDLPEGFGGFDLAVAGGMQPGTYPSGGAVPRVTPIWAACAPTLDVVAPDVYFGDFDAIFAGYADTFGHLLIPEMRTSAIGVSHMFRALGGYQGLGVSPFGVDSIPEGSDEWVTLRDAYRLLSAVFARRSELPHARFDGFMLNAAQPSAELRFGDTIVRIGTQDPYGITQPVYPAYGIVLEESAGRYLAVGRGYTLTVESARERTVDDGPFGILSVTELDFDGEWSVVRELNGDESGSGSHARFLGVQPAPPSIFPVRTFDESTAILRIETYGL